jgi:transposase-like protein
MWLLFSIFSINIRFNHTPLNMEKRYQNLSLFEFQQTFKDGESCMVHLAKIKWPEGYKCGKCDNTKYCKGKLAQSRQCTKCGYQETPTSGTLFHKIKFPLLKAFYIVYFMSTNKKGITSTELSRKLALRQKTCWSFRKKVTRAMASSQKYPLIGSVEVDEMVIGQQEEGVRGRQNNKKKLVVVAIEKKAKGISRMYAKVIKNASNKELGPFFKNHISPRAKVKTDGWSGYSPLKGDYPYLEQALSGKKGDNFTDMHRCIMMFKGWLRGMHHSVEYLQDYLDEYTYRFNRNFMDGAIFDNLLTRVVQHPPVPIKSTSID